MKERITLILIVKDEEKNLPKCLQSVQGHVDEIIIVDTGSTDNTVEIASRFTDKIYRYPWEDDFSAARNFALAQAGGDWILSLDADEELVSGDGDLRRLINTGQNIEAYLLSLHYPTADSSGAYNRFHVLRLFRNNGRYFFQGKIHEQVVVQERGVVGVADRPSIRHKLLSTKERNRKRERNLALLKKACSREPDNLFLQYYLGVEWLMLGKPQKALPYLKQSYEQLTDEHLLFRAPALRYLIMCLQALGRLEEAICLCLEADVKYPDYTDIYYLGGVLFEEKKEYQLAVKWLKQAVLCGLPPALYSHLHGTESFLAYYHLGYCTEMLGQKEEAIENYEKALQSNPHYVYPLYNLFMLFCTAHGPRATLAYLREKGLLAGAVMAKEAAKLFFISGYANLAYSCLADFAATAEAAGELKLDLAKYAVLSGRVRHGLKLLNTVSVDKVLRAEDSIYRVLAHLFLGEFTQARTLALALWKQSHSRCLGHALLCLIQVLDKGTVPISPLKIREEDVLEQLLKIFDICSYYLPERSSEADSFYFKLKSGLEALCTNISAEGCLRLAECYGKRAGNWRSFCANKFGLKGK